MLPSIVGMIVFSLLPIVISIVVSLTDWNGLDKLNAQTLGERLCGLENYGAILRSTEFWNVLGHTVYYIVLYIPLVLVMSLFIASILNRNMRGIGVFRVLYYIPVLTSWVAASLIWKWVLSPQYGVINQLLGYLGVRGPEWLTDKFWAMPAIVLASVWKDMGFYGLFLLSGLKAIDTGYYEAAQMDGAGSLCTFFVIGIPLGMPGIFSVLILSFLEYWNTIEQPMTYLKTKSLLPLSLYLPQMADTDMATAFAASIVTLLPAILLFFGGQDNLEQGIAASGEINADEWFVRRHGSNGTE